MDHDFGKAAAATTATKTPTELPIAAIIDSTSHAFSTTVAGRASPALILKSKLEIAEQVCKVIEAREIALIETPK